MNQPRRRTLALLLLAALAVAGCSQLPTDPMGSSSQPGSSPSTLSASTPDGGASNSLLTNTTTSSASNSKTIYGLLGGRVSAGNFTIIVPPAAFLGSATITVTQPDVTKPVVNLSISPASQNHFLLPVLLVADASPMPKSLISISYISWWNPTTGQWEKVANCTINVLTLQITAPLWHFSTYRVETGGRAGW